MNAINDDTTTDLLELAKASWNHDFLVPSRSDLIATRPLMVILQSIYDQPQSASLDVIIRSAQEQIEHTSCFSHFIEAQDGVSVLFLAEFGDDPDFISALYGSDFQRRFATSLRKALDLAVTESTEQDSEDDDVQYRPQHLWTIIVLPEPTLQHIDLESIQDAIPDFTGKAYWYDPSDELVKVQAWEDGDLDTGYLWALQEEEDSEGYTLDAAPGRAFFAGLVADSK